MTDQAGRPQPEKRCDDAYYGKLHETHWWGSTGEGGWWCDGGQIIQDSQHCPLCGKMFSEDSGRCGHTFHRTGLHRKHVRSNGNPDKSILNTPVPQMPGTIAPPKRGVDPDGLERAAQRMVPRPDGLPTHEELVAEADAAGTPRLDDDLRARTEANMKRFGIPKGIVIDDAPPHGIERPRVGGDVRADIVDHGQGPRHRNSVFCTCTQCVINMDAVRQAASEQRWAEQQAERARLFAEDPALKLKNQVAPPKGQRTPKVNEALQIADAITQQHDPVVLFTDTEMTILVLAKEVKRLRDVVKLLRWKEDGE